MQNGNLIRSLEYKLQQNIVTRFYLRPHKPLVAWSLKSFSRSLQDCYRYIYLGTLVALGPHHPPLMSTHWHHVSSVGYLHRKGLKFDSNFTPACNCRSKRQLISTELGNGQTTDWFNTDPVHWRMHVSSGLFYIDNLRKTTISFRSSRTR